MQTNLIQKQHEACWTIKEDQDDTGFQSLQVDFYTLDPGHFHSLSVLYQSWVELFQKDPHSELNQHPDHVLRISPLLQNEHTSKSGHFMLCRKGNQSVAAAVLLPKSLSTKILRGIGPPRQIGGYILSGQRFLMSEDYQHDQAFHKFLLEATISFCSENAVRFLLLEDILIDDPLNQSLKHLSDHCLAYSHTGFQPRSLIQFPENPIEYWNKFRSKSRRKHRKLLRDNSELQLVRVTRPDQVAEFLESAHQISLNTWQTQRLGLRIKNDDKELEEMMFLALNGSLRSYLILDKNKPIAFKIGSQHRGVYHDLEFGFDLDYASISPGETLLLLILEDLIESDTPRTFDFGTGDAEYKQRYSSEMTQSRSVLLFPSSLRNKCLLRYLKSSCWIDQFSRKVLKSSGVYTALRQLSRYRKLGSR
ncbi:GNAT family N-acetyltransferase [Gimesia algae]|uniref:BioF2-like acetyltransferase domain-containing protein n=1 Tax=Gimesia algae TaxID=2527971 RepID=A0A517VFC4_9PLAN|nr:GNAT family N-acetyltransferase [Gimesia algae]QDT91713.1 hypothetical protein Pan161_33750 [Gimesia algae]